MSNITTFTRRIEALLAVVEDQQRQRATSYGRVVIYNPATGQPLPGVAPPDNLSPNIWIPDNGRDNYATVWLPQKDVL
jgi:hypothetical protein